MIGEGGDAKLIYYVIESGSAVTKEVDVFIKEVDIFGNEFYTSYQSGINVNCAFEVNSYDFEETRHIDQDTNKPMYASEVEYNGARYNIIRHQSLKNSEDILLICG